jgi:hypothetical protein
MSDAHKHEPFLYGWTVSDAGKPQEIWRCLADFPVTEFIKGDDGQESPGPTREPGHPDHPYGEPCGWEKTIDHDPKKWTNERANKLSQRELYRKNAPKDD